jgi:hypothetical protein
MLKQNLPPFDLAVLGRIIRNLGWDHAQNTGFVSCRIDGFQFHAALWLTDKSGDSWVFSSTFPAKEVPDSAELRKFLNEVRLPRGSQVRVDDSGGGLVQINTFGSIPSVYLSEQELRIFLASLFLDGKYLGEEVLGRFGGKWRDEE